MSVAPALQTLINQVDAMYPDQKAAEIVGEPDGLGIQRTAAFDPSFAPYLADQLNKYPDDRLAHFTTESDGELLVTVVDNYLADFTDEWLIQPPVVLEPEDVPTEVTSETPKTPPVKRAPRKRAT